VQSGIPQSVGVLNPEKLYMVIWTTTPWTLPANLAICLHPEFIYAAVAHGDDTYIVAEDRLSMLVSEWEWKDYKIIGQGTFTWANGNKYEGEWKDEKRTGQGKYIFSNGGKVVGEFRGGKYWNTKEYDKEGNIIRTWVNGKGIKP